MRFSSSSPNRNTFSADTMTTKILYSGYRTRHGTHQFIAAVYNSEMLPKRVSGKTLSGTVNMFTGCVEEKLDNVDIGRIILMVDMHFG